MAFSDDFLDEIRQRVGLVELIGRSVRLTRRGREFLGCCPFHDEKTPSFTVNEQKGFFHCFGCGAHGSLFDFVMRRDGVDFPGAVERLAGEAGLALPKRSEKEREQERRRHDLHDVIAAASEFFEASLWAPEGEPALAYLRGRGLDEAIIRRFRLGYAPAARTALKTALARRGIEETMMRDAGLVIQPDDAARAGYDRFRDRVMFPISDRRGRGVGFGGRLLGPGEPKYLNSPETVLFHKGSLLYGLPAAAEAARTAGRIIVVEGYMDVIGLAGAGYGETVAPLGTALSEDQLRELWRLAPTPILCFDPDAAGRRAAERAAERALPLLRPGFGARFAFLQTDTGDDPDAVARRYSRQFLDRAFADAGDLSELLLWLETAGRRLESAEERAAAQGRLRQRVAAITDATVRTAFLDMFRERLFPRRGRDGKAGAPSALAPPARAPTTLLADAEQTLLAIILAHPPVFEQVEEDFGSLTFRDRDFDALRQLLITLLSGAEPPDRATLRERLRARGGRETLDRVLGDPVIRRHWLWAEDADATALGELWRTNSQALRRAEETPIEAAPRDALARARRHAARLAIFDDDA